MYKILVFCWVCTIPCSCMDEPFDEQQKVKGVDTQTIVKGGTVAKVTVKEGAINTGNTKPVALVSFARSLIGSPYQYASSNPVAGFDCSGFISYVFNHFSINVPRSSVDFTNQGQMVPLLSSAPGDLILFTGTDSTIKTVGHMGIITNTADSVVFIHSTSGKAFGVTETTLNPYYMRRFVKVIRVF